MKLFIYYYLIKPIIPRRIQLALRRAIAAYKRRLSRDIWPIDPSAAIKPPDWKGWPDQKRFAFILHHDVDSAKGLENSAKLIELEKRLGFRSSFNFVPEDYATPDTLRKTLMESGFEVGVHGLHHDGKIFMNKAKFGRKARRINHYLQEWESIGFTSPSMLRNLDLMAELDIKHGCSTFDTDPFEPHPQGMKTIFPFYVRNLSKTKCYLELPYTLPQDHGLFIIHKEKDISIWKQKLAWIAEKGGMVLLNSHPDYMNFDGHQLSSEEYPASYYSDFLAYIEENYHGQYWHALPREMARFWEQTRPIAQPSDHPPMDETKPLIEDLPPGRPQVPALPKAKIWIDLDNTPHVPFFIPIIRELERRGHKIVLTARDAFQVCELADEKGMTYIKVGHHYGKNRFMKVFGLLWRSAQLLPFYLREKPDLALSHGSRSQTLLCNLLRIPTVLVMDYEHSRTIPLARPRWKIYSQALFGEKSYRKPERIRYYRGIKEDVYVPDFKPDFALLEELDLRHDEMVILVRPPASEAHYYNPESDVLFVELMSRICRTPDVRGVLLPRTHQQGQTLRTHYPEWFKNNKTVVPGRAVDGLALIWLSDLVVSGGGTMNREAAALGVPVYSIFRGKIGGVDKTLAKEGRLTLIESPEEVWTKIAFARRSKNYVSDNKLRPALRDIVAYIEEIIRIEQLGSPLVAEVAGTKKL